METSGQSRTTSKKNSYPAESTDSEVKEESKGSLQTSEVADKPVASGEHGSPPSVQSDSGTGDSGKQGSQVVQSPVSSQSEAKGTSEQGAVKSRKSSEQKNSDVGIQSSCKAVETLNVQVLKVDSDSKSDEVKEEKPDPSSQVATEKLHEVWAKCTHTEESHIEKNVSESRGPDSIGSESVQQGCNRNQATVPPTKPQHETKDMGDDPAEHTDRHNDPVTTASSNKCQPQKKNERKLSDEERKPISSPEPATDPPTNHDNDHVTAAPPNKPEPQTIGLTNKVDQPAISQEPPADPPTVHHTDHVTAAPPNKLEPQTGGPNDKLKVDQSPISQEPAADPPTIHHNDPVATVSPNEPHPKKSETHGKVEKPLSSPEPAADPLTDHHKDSVTAASPNKSEARTSGPTDQVDQPSSSREPAADPPTDHHNDSVETASTSKPKPQKSEFSNEAGKTASSRDSPVIKPESSNLTAQKLEKDASLVDDGGDSSEEFKDCESEQVRPEISFDKRLRKLCSMCDTGKIVVVLHAFIDLKFWDVPYTLKDMKNMMVLRSSLGNWKGNDAVDMDIAKLEYEDNLYRLKTVLVVPRSTLRHGIQYKYFLYQEGKKPRDCYEFIKIDGATVFNRFLSERNAWNDTKDSEVIYHHYDDFILPKLPEKGWFGKVTSKLKKWVTGDRSLVDSLCGVALRVYLDKYCTKPLSPDSPVPFHELEVFGHVDTIPCIYYQLRNQTFYPHERYLLTRDRHNKGLSDDLQEWIFSLTDDHSATDVDIRVERELHTMTVGLILLLVAQKTDVLAACSSKIAQLLDLCRKPLENVAITVCKVKEQIYQDSRGKFEVATALKKLICAICASRKEPQCMLGVLLFLSMWISGNEACSLFNSTDWLSKDDLKQIRKTASASKNWMDVYERCCHRGLAEICPHLGEITLQISPLTAWPRLMETNSLLKIFEILSIRIKEEPSSKKADVLFQVITKAVQRMNQRSKWDISDLEQLTQYLYPTMESILEGQYAWYLRNVTIRLCLCVYSHLSDGEDKLPPLMDKVTLAVSIATNSRFGYSDPVLRPKFGCTYNSGYEFEIEVWTNILSLCDEKWLILMPKWIKLCLQHVRTRFTKLTFTDMLKALEVLQKAKKPSEALGKTFMDCTIEKFFSYSKQYQESLIKGHYGSGQFRNIMVAFLRRECPDQDKVDLGHLCTWRMWPCYFKVFGILPDKVQDVPQGMDPYRAAVNVMEVTVGNIKSRDITKQEMEMIISNQIASSNFTEILEILYNSNEVQELRVGLEQLQDMYMTFNKDFDRIYRMLQNCEPYLDEQGKEECRTVLSVERASLHTDVRSLSLLLESCCPKGLFGPLLHMSDPFNLTFGELACGSVKKFWSRICTPCDLSSLARTVWPCFLSGLGDLVKKYINLSIPCGVADDYLPHTGEEEDLRCMLDVLTACHIHVPLESKDWICEAVKKIRIYRKAKHQCNAAKALMNLKHCLKIAGRFDILASLVNAASMGNEPLSSISEHMGSVVDFLDISEQHLEDLLRSTQELAKSTDLIAWIQNEVKDVGELRTFISMAQMAHCEDASTWDCLNSLKVVMKLSPFIFKLHCNSDLQHLVECCKIVLLERLNDVPVQLRNCSRNLEKYKEVQRMLGSVEKTVYGQVKDLTTSGVFTLRSPAKGHIPKDIHDLVHVAVKGKNTASKQQYSLNELKDLQSKLALIRGNISDEDDKGMAESFWKGLELTVRGADALLELLLAGHTHYRSFCYVYSLKEQFFGIQDFTSFTKRVLDMEKELGEWKNEIERCRGKFYELNYFTAHQLSLICEELSKQSCQGVCASLPMWFRNLLQCISPTIRDDIVQGILVRMIEAKEMEKNATMFSLPMAPVDTSDHSLSVSDMSDALCMPSSPSAHSHEIIGVEYLDETDKDNFDELVEMEFSENLILRGIRQVGSDFDVLLKFCTENSADDVSSQLKTHAPEEGVEGLDEENESEYMSPTIAAITDEGYPLELAREAYSNYGDDVNAALAYCIENEERHVEQKEFLESALERSTVVNISSPAEEYTLTTSPIAISEENLWSLRDVATFLRHVAEGHEGDVTHDVRAFNAKYFENGSPNLLIVPRKNIFRYILALYMCSEDLPLPTAEEVLYCHSKTTTEDIRLLWRRAVDDPHHRRIFCLVCEQSLSYRIAKESVQDIRELMQGHSGFRLVIICCQEDERNSLLMGDLREYKRSLPPLPKEDKIAQYLQEHFVPDDIDFASARIDPDESYVRVVTSTRPGMGKSLYIQRLVESLQTKPEVHSDPLRVITLHGPDVNNDSIVRVLRSLDEDLAMPVIFHIDVSERVLEDIGAPLFNMLILRALQSSKGVIWRCRQNNLYAVEITLLTPKEDQGAITCSLDLMRLLPTTCCLSPKECLKSSMLHGQLRRSETLIGMDEAIRTSSSYQRVFQYLSRFTMGQSVDDFVYTDFHTEGTYNEWITLMCRYSGLPDPTWLELSHFVSFLNAQLTASERSVYCDQDFVSDVNMGVTGFKSFVVKFMIKMSVDFTVPSIKSEVGLSQEDGQGRQDVGDDLEGYQIVKRRAWESSIHPYIFFNRDTYRLLEAEEHYDSMTFVGFNLQQVGKTVNLVDLNHQVIEERIMTEGLYRWLRQSGVEVRQDPQTWTKLTILKKLCRVLESKFNFDPDQNDFYFRQIDPDPTYELTFDNLVKMLAIQMRFRCGIPVVIMGETGCGKTRLIRYMCQLQSCLAMDPNNVGGAPPCQTFFIMKMHGGITEGDIVEFVSSVQKDARMNQQCGFQTVVFFDEANTSDAIGLVKEIMCDRRMRGKQIKEDIKFIAACNPYKKHSQEMIESLESAGLGFSVRIQETKQKLGSTPLRHLVYRVLELPASMKPLVYDYGGLTDNTEEVYIGRMVQNHVQRNPQLAQVPGLAAAVAKIISWCHAYMRRRKDECSYVSLRDVERCMIVFEWFRKMYDVFANEKDFMRLSLHGNSPQDGFSVECTMAMIVSLTVCYYARLIDRREFETQIVGAFSSPLVLANGKETFTETISWCQETFLSNMELGPNIAHNAALRENVFMMTICVELRIPLFLVGKPGSSKSLAKSVVATSMKGQVSEKPFLKNFKSVQLLSYQCSQLSTPQSIIDVFNTARNIQKGEDCSRHVAVVVLDEVGLAEDSPSLPLKALHPLLEDGTDGSDPREIQVVKREERVGFIGISNWALDPAKMNRGIMVRRGKPDVDELVNSARGICSNDSTNNIRKYLEPMLRDLATAYSNIIEEQMKKGKRKEFFGLRDFYSLVKMLYCLVSSNTPYQLTTGQLRHAVLRNFGGIDRLRPFDFFEEFCIKHKELLVDAEPDDPSCEPLGLIKESLSLQNTDKPEHRHNENRYLLFLTENDAALQIMQDYLVEELKKPPYVLFGSSFPKDKDYTQVCRNINQIKICMETGRTIVLLNLDNLYESLYDLLNQYYTVSMDKRYVDLGLQTHRIKCRVHDEFKLILIAEKDNVYERFPIPLINRLEKHLVTASTIMTPEQSQLCERLKEWIEKMSHVSGRHFKPGDVFVGYQSETPVAVVLQACKQVAIKQFPVFDDYWESEAVAHSKELLIKMACPDALARLKQTDLRDEAENIWDMYFKQQQHLCLSQFIHMNVHSFSDTEDDGPSQSSSPLPASRQDSEQEADKAEMGLLAQVTTYSQPLAPVDVHRLCRTLQIDITTLIHMYLEELDAEADFTDRMRKHLSTVTKGDTYILVQCSSGHFNKDLISCARHKAVDVLENFKKDECWKRKYRPQNRKVHIIFIISLPKTPGGSKFIAFQGGQWMCVHLDDLRAPEQNTLNFYVAVGTPLSELFYPGREGVVLHERLESCLAAAVAQLPDSFEKYRLSREDILTSLRKAVGVEASNTAGCHTQFYEALVQHIRELIKQNEDAQLEVTKLDWAVREAMDPDRLQEGGTFLNTLLKRVDHILTDLLAYIIEFVNQHNNLRLCHSDHLNRLWVQIFENRQLCTFSYEAVVPKEDIVPPIQKQGSFSVGEYECQMPFSWIFIAAVESHMMDHGSDVNSLYQAFKTTSVGDILYAINDEELNLPQLYLKDFVAGVIQPTTRHEAEILELHLQVESERLLVSLQSKSLLHHLLSYHVAYHSSRLQYIHYRELGRIFPALHQTLLSKVSTEEHKPLDLLAVDYILTKVTPKPIKDKEFWQLQNLREKYIKSLRDCQSTIDEVLDSSPVGTDSTRKFSWQKIRAVQMYIEHLVLPFQENDQVYKGAFRLWSILNRLSSSFSDMSCLEHFKMIINSVDNSIAKSLNQQDSSSRRDALEKMAGDVSQGSHYAQYCQAVKMLFLEVISVLCFGSGSYGPPKADLIEGLMGIVFNQQQHRTQDLTPFEWEASDENPVIRSVLLQLIIKRDWEGFDVGTLIEEFMRRSRGVSVFSGESLSCSSDVCVLVVTCLEDKARMCWKQQREYNPEQARFLESLCQKIESSLRPFTEHDRQLHTSFRWLHSIAQLRCCLSIVADILNDHVKESPTRPALSRRGQHALSELVQLLANVLLRDEFQDLALYLSKQIARKHGMKSLRAMFSQGLHFVLPKSLHSDDGHQTYPDLYVLCGNAYCDIRQSLVQSALDESVEAFQSALQHIPPKSVYCVPLAIFAKTAWPVSQRKSFTEEMVHEASVACSRLGTLNNKLTAMCHSLLERNIGGRSTVIQPSQDFSRRTLTSLVLQTAAVILMKGNQPLLKPFANVLEPQQGIDAQYLPTMPEDFLVEAMTVMDMRGEYRQRSDMRGQFFACPKGHPYIITECTGPNQGMLCPKCGAGIGAQRSQIASGNYRLQKVNRKETGYTLGDAASRSRDAVPERNLSPVVCAVTRFILHACFLWSSCHCSEEALVHIRNAMTVQVQDLAEFFWQHLKLDLIVIGKALSRGEDDVTFLLSAIIRAIAAHERADVDGSMASKNIRKTWENMFSRIIVDPVLGNAHGHISDAVTRLTEDAAMAEDEVFLAVYEKTNMEPTLTQTLLTYRSKINVQDLTAALVRTPNGRQQHPLLYRFLNDEPLLRALQYLPGIVRLQRALISCFSHRLDHDEAGNMSIGEALGHAAGSEEALKGLKYSLNQLRQAWSIVREKLPHHRISVPKEEIEHLADITDVHPVSYLLPSNSGHGLCSLALSDFLLFQQNELLEFCRKSLKYSGFPNKPIPMPHLQPFHMISYEEEIDSIILTHCRYSLKFGRGQDVKYDFGALEKHIYDRFLVGKPEIDGTTQSEMIYSSDVIQQDVFDQLRQKIKSQDTLSQDDQKDVLRKLHGNLREISEALHTLTIAISFLASKGGNKPDMPLSRYIISVLRIRKTEFCKKFTLSQVLSLWETLALQRSKLQALNGKKIPFNGFDASMVTMFEDLNPATKEEFTRWLQGFPLDSWMALLFKFIQLRLKSLGPGAFEWPLVDTLDGYVDRVDDNNIQDHWGKADTMPEDILVKNAVHVWHLTVHVARSP